MAAELDATVDRGRLVDDDDEAVGPVAEDEGLVDGLEVPVAEVPAEPRAPEADGVCFRVEVLERRLTDDGLLEAELMPEVEAREERREEGVFFTSVDIGLVREGVEVVGETGLSESAMMMRPLLVCSMSLDLVPFRGRRQYRRYKGSSRERDRERNK